MAGTANKPWAPVKEPEDTVLNNANVVLPDDGKVIKGSLHLQGGKVICFSHGSDTNWRGARCIDLKGMYVCPGLIDCHSISSRLRVQNRYEIFLLPIPRILRIAQPGTQSKCFYAASPPFETLLEPRTP